MGGNLSDEDRAWRLIAARDVQTDYRPVIWCTREANVVLNCQRVLEADLRRRGGRGQGSVWSRVADGRGCVKTHLRSIGNRTMFGYRIVCEKLFQRGAPKARLQGNRSRQVRKIRVST